MDSVEAFLASIFRSCDLQIFSSARRWGGWKYLYRTWALTLWLDSFLSKYREVIASSNQDEALINCLQTLFREVPKYILSTDKLMLPNIDD